MNCTCPSGDGSLRWPCPVYPPTASDPGSGQDARLDIAMIASIRAHLASVEYKGHVFRLTRDEVAGLLAAVDERDRLRAQLCAEPDEVNAAAAALARHESQNATDPFHFPLTDHMYLALRETAAGSRFDPDNAALRESLAWHARITADMQRRVLEAEKYVRSHTGDVKLLAILGGDEKAMRLFAGVDTHTGEVSA